MILTAKTEPGFRVLDFDAKVLKPVLRKAGNDVRKEARRLIARKAVSAAGEFPGKDSGEMQRSVKVQVSRSGYTAFVAPSKTARMEVYYPAFVVYGHRAPYTETAASRRTHRKRVGEKVAEPRANFIIEAARHRQVAFESAMAEALPKAIKEGLV